MEKIRQYGLMVFFLCQIWAVKAQKNTAPIIEGEILVQVQDSQVITQILAQHKDLYEARCIAPNFQVWQLFFNPKTPLKERLADLAAVPGIEALQAHHTVAPRLSRPNDTRYSEQWHLNNTGTNGGLIGADVDAERAWDLARGGTTIDGDTIVIAIVDDGILLTHPDLQANIFVNRQEIPQNGIDDDNNGYIDDINGWNTSFQNNQVGNGGHGVEVSGVAGAIGNNNRGVSGLNWQIKLLPLVKDGTEASIIAAYDYAYQMRRLYNESQGQKGAFIVATNNSFGLSGFFANDAPIWCSLYDKMGSVGILSVAAAPNSPVNIDVVGDLPATCPSQSLIVVTSTTHRDLKATDAGFGSVHVDIGAPGVSIWTTSATGDYTAKNGTSLACPIVSGLAALAYNMPCPDFINTAKSRPNEAVLLLRDWILRGGDPNDDLANRSSSGRRVNAYNTLTQVQNHCSGCTQASQLRISADTQRLRLYFTAPTADSVVLEYRLVGSSTWQKKSSRSSPLLIEGLARCTLYELRLTNYCGATSSTPWTQIVETEGCCRSPKDISIYDIDNQSFKLKFKPVMTATGYNLCLKETPTGRCLIETILRDTQFIATALAHCKTYSLSLQPICPNNNGTDTTLSIKTTGCGSCYDAPYCAPAASTANEWIDSFFIHNSSLKSGKNNGYRRFDTVLTTLTAGQTYTVGLKPGYPSVAYQEAARVWIDYNQDGDFDDIGETIYENTRFNSTVSGRFTVPNALQNGITRLRVGMRYVGSTGGSPPTPCELVTVGGEFEDYCIALSTRVSVVTTENKPLRPKIYPNPFESQTIIDNSESHLDIVSVALMAIDGRLIFEQKIAFGTPILNLNWPQELVPGLYFLKIIHSKGQIIEKLIRS